MADGFAPLTGLRVVELAQNLAGPWCARILADLGATVVKVEPPGGDSARAWGPPFDHGIGTLFTVANPGKRLIRLNLKQAEDRDRLNELLAEADVLVESFRPGALEALGFADAEVAAAHPRLIRASVRAYGDRGPLTHLPGYEPLMQAHAAMMSYTGQKGGEPVRVGTSVVDLGTGMWLAIGVLAALREREATGAGMRVSASLFDTAVSWSGYHLLGVLAGGPTPQPQGTGLPMICPYGAYRTQDGALMIAVGNDGLFGRFAKAVGRAEWLGDPRFATNPERVAHREILEPQVHDATGAFTSSSLLFALQQAGVPAAPIQNVAELAEDPQTAASEMVEQRDGQPSGIRMPLRFDGERPELPDWDTESGD